jgi:hypothetical protein
MSEEDVLKIIKCINPGLNYINNEAVKLYYRFFQIYSVDATTFSIEAISMRKYRMHMTALEFIAKNQNIQFRPDDVFIAISIFGFKMNTTKGFPCINNVMHAACIYTFFLKKLDFYMHYNISTFIHDHEESNAIHIRLFTKLSSIMAIVMINPISRKCDLDTLFEIHYSRYGKSPPLSAIMEICKLTTCRHKYLREHDSIYELISDDVDSLYMYLSSMGILLYE